MAAFLTISNHRSFSTYIYTITASLLPSTLIMAAYLLLSTQSQLFYRCLKWHHFVCRILLKKSPPRPPFKHNSFRSYYTHKYWKNQHQNIPATKYTILHASSLQNVMQNMLNPRTTPPPPPPSFLFNFFFLLFKKFVAVENKYSVLDLPENKFSGRACDENK